MSKRLQVYLTDEALELVEEQLKLANEGFQAGTITYSDLISEMVLTSKVDIKTLQLKRTDLRRSLRVMASQPDIDLDTIIKSLSELKGKTQKKSSRQIVLSESLT